MKFKEIQDKQKYFDENYPFVPTPELDEVWTCIHCEEKIKIGDYKVAIEYNPMTGEHDEFIVCPNAPDCDGTVMDWQEQWYE